MEEEDNTFAKSLTQLQECFLRDNNSVQIHTARGFANLLGSPNSAPTDNDGERRRKGGVLSPIRERAEFTARYQNRFRINIGF